MSSNSNVNPSCSEEDDSGPRDAPFDPSIEELIHDYDDERTLEEEEAMAADEGEPSNYEEELSGLEKEMQRPIEELLALYGTTPKVNVEEVVSNDSGNSVNKKSILNVLYERNIEDSNLFSITLSDDDEEDCDSDSPDVFITTSVGPAHQANVSDFISKYEGEYDNCSKDNLLWRPPQGLLYEEIEEYLKKVFELTKENKEGVISDKEEAALYLLCEMGNNISKALKILEDKGPLVLKNPNTNKEEWPENETDVQFAPKDFLRMKKINN